MPAPLEDSARKKPIKGWAMSTVRALLRNPKYAGRWAWNQRKFTSISGQRAPCPPARSWLIGDTSALPPTKRR
ncbi:recombinase family protein [Anaeromyxobacter oryzae]|uniref:recombinase family protein n=1 Tax=Anaeromyxobacter oryzae TaxID=2918170 RepID=UPI00384E36F1